jgi:hypothetical protein
MKIRFASLFAAIALSAIAAPAAAQAGPGEPPPLPDQEWREDWDQGDYPIGPDETGVSWEQDDWRGEDLPPQAYREYPQSYGGYTPEQRAEWLEECRRTRHSRDECEAILAHYERRYAAGPGYGYEGYERAEHDRYGPRGPAYGYGPPPGYGAYGAYGYGALPPVMWVKVPIVTKRSCGCAPRVVEEVVEERVVERVAAPPPERRVKIQRIVPAPAPGKNTKIRSTK